MFLFHQILPTLTAIVKIKTAHIPAFHVTREVTCIITATRAVLISFSLLKNVPPMKYVLDPNNKMRAFVGALDHVYVGKVSLERAQSF